MTALKITGQEESKGILLLVNEQQHGPYTEDQVKQYIISGQVAPNTFAWWEGMPEWRMLEDLPKFSRLMITSEPQAGKNKKLRYTPPEASMQCLATGLWAMMLAIVLVDVHVVCPMLIPQDVPVGIEVLFHAMLIVPPFLSAYLMSRRFCPKYFEVKHILGTLVFMKLQFYFRFNEEESTFAGIPVETFNIFCFSLCLLFGWKQGVEGFCQSFHLARPNDGRTQAVIGIILMLVLTCSLFVLILSGAITSKHASDLALAIGVGVFIYCVYAIFTRGINRIFRFGPN